MNSICVIISLFFLYNVVKPDESSEKLCRVRDNPLYPRDVWNFWTGFYCYNYSNDIRLNSKYGVIPLTFHNYSIPGSEANLQNGTTVIFTYDYSNDFNLDFIKASYKTDYYFQMWIDCCEEAAYCCDNVMNSENIYPTKEYPCPTIWDGWSCFTPTQSNTVEEITCSKQAYSTESEVCEILSKKQCFEDGWNQTTDYTVCAVAPVLRNRHTFNVITLSVSAVVAFPAFVIFMSLRTFRQNLRYILHRNLIGIIVIRNFLSIMSKEIILLDALKTTGSNNVMDDNSVACRVLAFFENAAKNGMYACMLADGFYLHKLIVRAFAGEPSLVYIYAAVLVLSFLPSLIWALVRDAHHGVDCWMVDDTNDQWIIDGFRIAILVINFLLLLDIIRVMAMKLKRGSISQQAKSTLRATLFLIPLFGLHIIIITNRDMVTSKACSAEDIYFYVSYTIEGLQGVMVAILFCYLNTEVQKELQNAFRKFAFYLESRFDIKLSKGQGRRRTTAATFVDVY